MADDPVVRLLLALRVLSLRREIGSAFGVKRTVLAKARSIATIASRLTVKVFHAVRDDMADFNPADLVAQVSAARLLMPADFTRWLRHL